MCPNCNHKWADEISGVMNSLKKVDFFWINRDQKSFEWFVSLLSQLELEMSETGGALGRFLEMHMYITSGKKISSLLSTKYSFYTFSFTKNRHEISFPAARYGSKF